MNKSLNIILLSILFNTQIIYTSEEYDLFESHKARINEILETGKKYSSILNITEIKETKYGDKKNYDKDILVPMKQPYIANFNPEQYLDSDEEGYCEPYERKYKVYIIDTNPRWKNIKLDSDSSNSDSSDSDSSISSGSVKKNKIKIPKYKRITVLETEKIISIHRERFQELVNIFNRSPKWSIAKMFDDPEIGIAIEEYINKTTNNNLIYSNNKQYHNDIYRNNYNKPVEFKTAQEGYNILVDRINNIVTEFNQIPNMQANLNNISLKYKQDSITQYDIDKLNTIICTLGKILTREKTNQMNFIKNNVMVNQKFSTPKK